MHVVIPSFLLVFVSEMGDKTQLLALMLALRFKKPWPIMAGILAATLLNHGLASWLGGEVAAWLGPQLLKWILALLFFGFAAWILVPDSDEGLEQQGAGGAFATTLVAFFLAEMGDKTQLATVALGARYGDPILVTAGTTLGMLAADGLAVAFGERLTQSVPMHWVRRAACATFAGFGVLILMKI